MPELLRSRPAILKESSFHEAVRSAVMWPVAALALAILLLLGLLAYLFVTAGRADYSSAVLAQVSRVEKLAVDMETGVRGYGITGDIALLEPFEKASTIFAAELNRLEALVRDDPLQLDEVGALRKSHAAWSEFAANARERVQSQLPADIAAHLQGKELMDSVRGHISAMQQHEQRLLAERSAARGQLRAISVCAVVLSGLILAPVIFASVCRALWRVNRDYREALDSVESLASFPEKNPNPILELAAETGEVIYANAFAQKAFPDLKAKGWQHEFLSGLKEAAQPLIEGKSAFTRREMSVGRSCYTQTISYLGDAKRLRVYSSDITETKNIEVALRESDERFRKVFEHAATGIAIADGQAKFLTCNPAFCALLGYTEEELRKKPADELLHPDDYAEDMARVRSLQEQRLASYEIENRYVRKDGQPVWVRKFVSALRDATGTPMNFVALVTDVRERKRAEEAHRKLAAIVESSDDAILSKDLDGVITSWNRGAERLFGYTAKEAIGQPVTILIPPERLNEEPKILERIRRGELVEHYETLRRDKDGKLLDISLSVSPVADSQGRIVGASSIARDVTDQKRAERALRESEERYRSLFESIDEGFCVIEMIFDANDTPVDYRFIEVNPAFERQAGMQDATGKRMLEFVSEIEPHWLENYGRVAITGKPIRFADEYKSLRSWFDVYAFRVGEPERRRVAVIFNNITKRKQAEAELLQSRAELAAANAELASRAKELDETVEKRTTELRETVQQLETFSYSIVHDMRAPLRSMRSFAGFLHQDYAGKLDPKAQDYLRRIMDSAARMDALITDVLSYSRVSRGLIDLAAVDLDRLVPEIIEQYPHFQEWAGSIHVIRPLPRVSGNTALLTQVFSNLLGNALKFVPEGREPRVHVRAETNGGRVRIWVEDNGIGVPPEQRDRIFGLFQRLHRPDQYAGTGVGLAIVKRAVEKMGGRTGVESGSGQGSRFWIELRMPDTAAAENVTFEHKWRWRAKNLGAP